MFNTAMEHLINMDIDGREINNAALVEVAQSLRGREWRPLYEQLFNYISGRGWEEARHEYATRNNT